MRTARMKARNEDAIYHLMARTAGRKGEYPFDDEDKEKAFKLVTELCRYYLVEPICMTQMGNHTHICVWCPGTPPTPEEAAERYNAYHEQKKTRKSIHPSYEEECARIAKQMIDISAFMGAFMQQFSVWYNKKNERRGSLWADRFKSVILDGTCSLWTCVQYVELNPVRARIVDDPADYRWCSYGRHCGGDHPFQENFFKHMRRSLGHVADDWSDDQVMGEFRARIRAVLELEQNPAIQEDELHEAIEEARQGETMPLKLLRRIRHLSTGGIVGTKLFVRETAMKHRDTDYVNNKQFSRGTAPDNTVLYCFRRLRLID